MESTNGRHGDESGPLGGDLTRMAAENASWSQAIDRDTYAFSGAEIRRTFLADGTSIGDTILRSVFKKDVSHLVAMQIEQGLRVVRRQAQHEPDELPDRVKAYATLPPALLSAMIDGLVSAAEEGESRQEALVAWSGGAMMMSRKRNVGQRLISPNPASSGGHLS